MHACEKGEIVGFGFFYKARSGQYTYKLLVHHPESAIVANYGEVTPDSLKRTGLNVGSQVEAGQVIGYVSDTDMLHFETYKPAASKEGSSATARWMKSEKRPARLLNPTRYLLFLSENGRDP